MCMCWLEVSLQGKAVAPRLEEWPKVGEAAEVTVLHAKDPFEEATDPSEIFCLLVFISIFQL